MIEVWHVVLPALQVVSFIILSLFSGAKRARRNANPGAAEADVSSSDSEDEEEGGPVEVRQEREREKRAMESDSSRRLTTSTACLLNAFSPFICEASKACVFGSFDVNCVEWCGSFFVTTRNLFN